MHVLCYLASCRWSEDCLIAEEIVLESVLQQSDVCVLDTPTNVWVWLSGDYNRTEQPTPFTLVNVRRDRNRENKK